MPRCSSTFSFAIPDFAILIASCCNVHLVLEKKSKVHFQPSNPCQSLILTIQLQNRISLAIEVSKLFIFLSSDGFVGRFCLCGGHVDVGPLGITSLSSIYFFFLLPPRPNCAAATASRQRPCLPSAERWHLPRLPTPASLRLLLPESAADGRRSRVSPPTTSICRDGAPIRGTATAYASRRRIALNSSVCVANPSP
jgi:hypothetical protein